MFAQTRLVWMVALCVLVGASRHPCQSQEALRYEFDVEVGGWQPLEMRLDGGLAEPKATLDITDLPENVKSGIGALQFAYEAEKGVIRAAVLGQPNLAGMRSLRFWIKSSATTPVLVQLREEDESEYMVMTLLPERKWQRVVVNLADFWLDEDSVDENNQLDADQVAAIVLADVAPFLAMLADAEPGLAGLFPVQLGPRELFLDDLEFSPEPVPELHPRRETAEGTQVTIDTFDSGMLLALPFGGATADIVEAEGDSYLQIQCEAQPFAGVITPAVQGLPLDGLQRITFRIKCTADCVLAVSLEERDDSRYSATLVMKGSEEWQTVNVAAEQFALDDDSEDENGQLDAGVVKNLTIADISGMIGLKAPRTLLLDDIVALLGR
jgi:hypothetical protein